MSSKRRTNFSAESVMSWLLTPSTVAFLPASVCCVFSSSGSSSVHGLHHEAQKFRTTTLPL